MAITLLDNETPESPTSIVSSGNVDTPVSGINNLKDPYEGRSLLQKNLIQDDIKLARDTIKWRQGERKKLDHNALNFEKWLPEVPKEHRVRSLIQGVMDAEMDMNPASVTSYETARVMLDRQVFGGDGSADDDAIFMKIQGRAKETKEKLEFYGKLEDEATLSALMGDDPYLKRLNPKFLFDPVFKKEKARSLQVWKDTISGIEEEYGDILPDVRKLWKMVDQDKPDLYKVADIIFKMDDDELDSAARILGKLQELQGSISSDRGVLGNIGEQSGRDKERTGSGLKGAAIEFFSKVAEGLLIEGEEITGLDNSQAIEGEQGRQENLDRSERFLAEIRRFRDQRDPIVKASKEGSFLGHVEGAVYAIPGVGMTIAASAIPIIGQANTISMLKQSAEDGYYLRALDATGDRNLSRKLAEEVSLPIVALQYLPERFGIGAITRKLPGLNKVLGKLPSAMQGRFARILAGTTARGVAETTTEEIQAILTEFGNDILNGLKEDIPEADWDAHWANFGGRNLETFLSIAPYSGLSAARHDSGLGKAVEVGKKASRDQLLASGYKSEDVDAFQSAETPLAQRSSFNKMLSNQDSKTEEAKQAVGRVIENRKATIAAHRKLLEAGTILGVRMTKDSSSYEVYDTESGEAVTTVETPAEASQIVYGAIGARDRAIQNHVDALTSKLQAARMIVDETGVTQEIEDTKWLTTEEAGRIFAGSDESIAEEVELLEQAEGGSGEVSRAVFDTVSGVNIPAGTHGRIKEVTKLFKGSSISTLIHEKSHSVRRKLMANGEFTNAEQIAFFRKLNEVLKGKKTRKTKDGRETALEFQGFDGDKVTEKALDEAWAYFSEVMLLKSKNGKKSKMRELLNTNLSAMVGDGTPGASKFKAFIRAMRDWLGLNLGRAAAIDKALRDGKLDAAEMEKFRAAVMGETIQGQFENEVIETHKENFVPTENIPFSIGSTEVTPNAETRTFLTKDGGVVGPATFSISAFHGTPHKVGRFSTDRIGTGEGAQVYGWGLYFAESRKVGEQYSTTLASEGFDIIGVFDGKTVRQSDPLPPDELMGVNEFRAFRWLAQGSFEEAQEKVASLNVSEAAKNAQLEAIKNLSGRVSGPPTGNLYTVNLKVEPEELLDWDKPLSEQSELVREVLKQDKPRVEIDQRKDTMANIDMNNRTIMQLVKRDGWWESVGPERTGFKFESPEQAKGFVVEDASDLQRDGANIYGYFKHNRGGAESASAALHKLGIKGIRYLDGNSRGSGEGSYNYVIFNEADIEILEENGQPVETGPAFSISNINKISSNNKADKLGIARLIPKEYQGKKMLPIMADLLGIGSADGVPIEGGPGHPLLYHGTGVAWRSNKGAIVGILGMLKSRGAIWKDADGKRKALVSVFAMSQDAHQSNRNAFLSFIKVIEDAKVSPEVKERLADYVRKKSTTKAFYSKRLQNFPESWTSQELDAFAEELAFSERASFLKMMRQSGAKDIGVPDAETIVRQLRDDSYDKVSSGSMLSLIEVDVDRLEKGAKENTLNASDFGVPEHLSYDTVLPGKIVTHLRQPVAMEVAFKSMVKKMGEVSPKSRPDYLMQAKLPTSVPLEALTAARIKDINQEQSGQTSIAKAKAYISALSGNWTTIDSKSQKGVADFVAAIDRNLYSETLTPMTDSEVKRKAKEGKMEVFGLQGFDVWFGLQAREDGGKELVSVVSNEHSTGGMLDLVMMKAIEEGATHLDC